jgi:hypothetical protein
MAVELSSSCDGNAVTVTSSGALDGAHVVVVDTSPSGGIIFSGDTNSDGIVTFTGCGMNVNIFASKSGYASESITEDLVACSQCAGQEQPTGAPGGCSSDGDCADNRKCSQGSCVPVECACGAVSAHSCNSYECCSDAQCGAGKVCVNNACRESVPEACNAPSCCTADEQCAANQNCLAATGAPASANVKGQCHDISGCGTVENHALVPYECGTEPGCQPCPQGAACTDHKCVATGLTAPQNGTAGGNVKVTASEGGAPCANCDLQITDPEGNVLTGQTDANGNFNLPLGLEGIYKISLLKDGSVLKSIDVVSLPKPAAAPAPGAAPSGDIFSALWVVGLLLVVVIGIYLFAKGRPKK